MNMKKAGAERVFLKEHRNLPHGVLNMNSHIFELKKESNYMI